jgi:hypothetical protein
MRYAVEGDDLCIRIPLDGIAENVIAAQGMETITVKDKVALALSLGRELCECQDASEDFYLSRTLDEAIERVICSADPSLEFEPQ